MILLLFSLTFKINLSDEYKLVFIIYNILFIRNFVTFWCLAAKIEGKRENFNESKEKYNILLVGFKQI